MTPAQASRWSVSYTAGVCTTSKAPGAARQLIAFLTGPIATPVIEAQGLER